MNERTKTGLEIVQVAVGIGVLGDVLLRQTPWGLNVFLFNLAFAAGMIMLLLRRNREMLNRQTLALLGAQVFLSSMFVWRDSIELRVADTVAILLILGVIFVPRMKIAASVAGVFHYFVGFLWSAFNAFFAPFVLLGSDIKWKGMPQTGWSKHMVAVLRGVFIVTPIILIFGGLFIAADAVYQGIVQRIFNVPPEVIFTHALLITVFAWMSAGYLRGVLLGREPVFANDITLAPQTDRKESKAETATAEAAES
ncbi:MAG: DUF4153 domain-containing protein, partial [Pyrinomonadaceae bacterium]